MHHSKRLHLLITTALVGLFSSVILFGGTAHAESLPLVDQKNLIIQQSQEVETKAQVFTSTTEEIKTLEQRKIDLATQLEEEQKSIESLKQKIAERKASIAAEKKRLSEIKSQFVRVVNYSSNSAGNTYGAGYCTWYVKNRRPDLPNSLGNANTWYARAASMGYSVGTIPKKGAVGTTTRGSLGHVVYVEAINPDGSIVISEMNYAGPYSTRTRSASPSEFLYIYEI